MELRRKLLIYIHNISAKPVANCQRLIILVHKKFER